MREALSYIGLQVEVCANVYGVAPCTASIGVTGADKCFNTFATCQDPENYNAASSDLLFAVATEYRPLGLDAIPSIQSIDFTPATLNPGEDLGTRASLRVTFMDHPTPDTGMAGDPYFAERAYNPYEQGTFWPKFRARHPYLRGETLVWYQGFVGQALEEMERRSFVVESFDGPAPDGSYVLIAHDILKMLDGDRAQVPSISNGRLLADITAGDTAATLTPAGIGDAEYDASGLLNIGGNEVVSFTRTGDALTIVRAQEGTTASAHKAADRVQVVKKYTAQDAADIIADLIASAPSFPVEVIPLAEWQAETANYLRRFYTGLIVEPTPVTKLVAELMRDCGLSIWWDDLDELVRLNVLRPIPTDATRFDEALFRKGSIGIEDQPDKRVSRVWVSYGQSDPTKGDDPANYRSTHAEFDADSETNYGQPKIMKIASRWIAEGGLTAAQRAAELQLGRFATPPRLFKFGLFRDAQATPRLGDGCRVSHRVLQDASGARVDVPGQFIRIKPSPEGFECWVEEFTFETLTDEDLSNRVIAVNFDVRNVNIRTMHDELYPTPRPGDRVRLVVSDGIFVGSESATLPALRTGTWPTQAVTGNRTSGSPLLTGLTVDTATWAAVGERITGTGIPAGANILSVDSATQITLTMNASSGTSTATALTAYLTRLEIEVVGSVMGRGGLGGTGANGNGDIDGGDGADGGPAVLVEYPIDLIDEDGLIGGGGGGGGGGPCRDPNDHKGGGGGGGQGDIGGDGGLGPGNGREGQPGTRTAPGAGGHGWTNNTVFQGPSDDSDRRGGDGGALGQSGQSGRGNSDLDEGAGGDPGASIDGISKVVTVGPAGDRRGPQIN